MTPFSLFLALKYLRPKRSFVSVVTLISVIGVMLGVAILVIVLSVMTGFDNMWRDKILSFKPHLTVQAGMGALDDEETLSAVIEKVPGVTGVCPAIQSLVLMQHMGRTAAPTVLSLDPDRATSVGMVHSNLAAGVFRVDAHYAVVGIDLAASLRMAVGDKFLVYSSQNVMARDEAYLPEELEVAGIFNLGMRDYDGSFVLASLETGRNLEAMDRGAHALFVMTDDPFRFEQYGEAVRAAIGPAYRVRTWEEVDQLLFNALRHEKTMMFVLLVFITIVAIFSVTNTLIVITVQKTNEIGLLKALGFSALQIMGAFVWHGLVQCVAGTLAGIGLGITVLRNLPAMVDALTKINVHVFPKKIYGLDSIPYAISWDEIGQIALFVMLFCFAASFIPAWRAANMDPVDAFRQEGA